MIAVAVAALAILHGTVTHGPAMPVCRIGAPCTRPAPRVLLSFTRAGHAAVVVRTDSAGEYRIRLTPGTYAVRANSGFGISPARVTVRSGDHRRDFDIDTGIR